MTRIAACLAGLLLLCGLGFCTREDGLPDPPRQELVPCRPDAAGYLPHACPPPPDDSGAARPAADAGM